ncbi:hypothetical protein BC567DRAFT_225275 [Phyllosticta citribraziliensis]
MVMGEEEEAAVMGARAQEDTGARALLVGVVGLVLGGAWRGIMAMLIMDIRRLRRGCFRRILREQGDCVDAFLDAGRMLEPVDRRTNLQTNITPTSKRATSPQLNRWNPSNRAPQQHLTSRLGHHRTPRLLSFLFPVASRHPSLPRNGAIAQKGPSILSYLLARQTTVDRLQITVN